MHSRYSPRFYRLKPAKHAPVYTLEEIAGRLGVTFNELRACISNAARNGMPLPPKPELPGTRTGASRRGYYELRSMIEWYKAHVQQRSKT